MRVFLLNSKGIGRENKKIPCNKSGYIRRSGRANWDMCRTGYGREFRPTPWGEVDRDYSLDELESKIKDFTEGDEKACQVFLSEVPDSNNWFKSWLMEDVFDPSVKGKDNDQILKYLRDIHWSASTNIEVDFLQRFKNKKGKNEFFLFRLQLQYYRPIFEKNNEQTNRMLHDNRRFLRPKEISDFLGINLKKFITKYLSVNNIDVSPTVLSYLLMEEIQKRFGIDCVSAEAIKYQIAPPTKDYFLEIKEACIIINGPSLWEGMADALRQPFLSFKGIKNIKQRQVVNTLISALKNLHFEETRRIPRLDFKLSNMLRSMPWPDVEQTKSELFPIAVLRVKLLSATPGKMFTAMIGKKPFTFPKIRIPKSLSVQKQVDIFKIAIAYRKIAALQFYLKCTVKKSFSKSRSFGLLQKKITGLKERASDNKFKHEYKALLAYCLSVERLIIEHAKPNKFESLNALLVKNYEVFFMTASNAENISDKFNSHACAELSLGKLISYLASIQNNEKLKRASSLQKAFLLTSAGRKRKTKEIPCNKSDYKRPDVSIKFETAYKREFHYSPWGEWSSDDNVETIKLKIANLTGDNKEAYQAFLSEVPYSNNWLRAWITLDVLPAINEENEGKILFHLRNIYIFEIGKIQVNFLQRFQNKNGKNEFYLFSIQLQNYISPQKNDQYESKGFSDSMFVNKSLNKFLGENLTAIMAGYFSITSVDLSPTALLYFLREELQNRFGIDCISGEATKYQIAASSEAYLEIVETGIFINEDLILEAMANTGYPFLTVNLEKKWVINKMIYVLKEAQFKEESIPKLDSKVSDAVRSRLHRIFDQTKSEEIQIAWLRKKLLSTTFCKGFSDAITTPNSKNANAYRKAETLRFYLDRVRAPLSASPSFKALKRKISHLKDRISDENFVQKYKVLLAYCLSVGRLIIEYGNNETKGDLVKQAENLYQFEHYSAVLLKNYEGIFNEGSGAKKMHKRFNSHARRESSLDEVIFSLQDFQPVDKLTIMSTPNKSGRSKIVRKIPTKRIRKKEILENRKKGLAEKKSLGASTARASGSNSLLEFLKKMSSKTIMKSNPNSGIRKHDKLEINLHYEYEHADILAIMKAKIPLFEEWLKALGLTLQHKIIIPEMEISVCGNVEHGQPGSLPHFLQFDHDERAKIGKRILLIPINTGGGHWETIVVFIKSDNTLQMAFHLDSFPAKNPGDKLKKREELFKKVYSAKKNQLSGKVQYVQMGAYACGVLSCENAFAILKVVYFLLKRKKASDFKELIKEFEIVLARDTIKTKRKKLNEKDTLNFRADHIRILAKSDKPEDIKKSSFYQKQYKNVDNKMSYRQRMRQAERQMLSFQGNIVVKAAEKLSQPHKWILIDALLTRTDEGHALHMKRLRNAFILLVDMINGDTKYKGEKPHLETILRIMFKCSIDIDSQPDDKVVMVSFLGNKFYEEFKGTCDYDQYTCIAARLVVRDSKPMRTQKVKKIRSEPVDNLAAFLHRLKADRDKKKVDKGKNGVANTSHRFGGSSV